MDELIQELEMHRQASEFLRLGRIAVKEAQEESRRLGVANVYFINGRARHYEAAKRRLHSNAASGAAKGQRRLRQK